MKGQIDFHLLKPIKFDNILFRTVVLLKITLLWFIDISMTFSFSLVGKEFKQEEFQS